jgi:hypothetical protein
VRGMNTKLNDFLLAVQSEYFDLIVITESWLSNAVHDSEFIDARYNVFRCDRSFEASKKTRGGGVLVAVRRQLGVGTVLCRPASSYEIVQVQLILNNNFKMFVTAIYLSPNASLNDYNDCFDFCEDNPSLLCSDNLVLGDFNLSEITDKYFNFNVGSNKAKRLGNFISLLNLNSFNNIKNSHGRTLDLILSTVPVRVDRDFSPFLVEDNHHPALLLTFDFPLLSKPTSTELCYFNYKKANFFDLYLMLNNSDWNRLYTFESVDDAVDYYYELLFTTIHANVPKIKKYSSNKYPVYFTKQIIQKIKLKNKIAGKRKYSIYYMRKFCTLRSEVKRDICLAYRNYMVDIQNNISKKVKNFWSFINSCRKSRREQINFEFKGEKYAPEDSAQAFADHFSSVFDNEDRSGIVIRSSDVLPGIDVFSFDTVTSKDVDDAIKILKPKRTCGPDGIPPYILKGCSNILVPALEFIFNLSLRTKTFPTRWKEARVIPVFKSGKRNDVSNYRPIAILNSSAKIFENIIYNKTFQHVKRCITDCQFGFMPQRSAVSNLLMFTNFISCNLDNGNRVDTVLLDFSKAFDKVNHNVLLNKMSSFGFPHQLLTLFASYLTNRSYFVTYNNTSSRVFHNCSGVPQGSNLGPLLFLLLINDISCCLKNAKCLIYADDVKVFRAINNIIDISLLQDDLNRIYLWCCKNKLYLNTSKCKHMVFTRQLKYTNYVLCINNKPLEQVYQVKDLGIWLDHKLTYKDHINYVINDANKLLGFVIRSTKHFNNIELIKLLFFSLVRSKIEYGIIVWFPYQQKAIQDLEIIQNKFLRYLYFKKFNVSCPRGFSTSELRNLFGVLSIQNRYNFISLVFLFKILNNLIDIPDVMQNLSFYVPYRSRPRLFNLFAIPRFNTDHQSNSYFIRSIRLFNLLNPILDPFVDNLMQFSKKCHNALIILQ